MTLIEPIRQTAAHGCAPGLHQANHSLFAAARRWLAAGCGWPVRTLTGCLVRALAFDVATRCSVCCLPFVKPRVACRIGGTADSPVEVLFPEGRERFELASSSGWSRVLGIDAVGGAPHCDFADEGGARVTAWCIPDWLGVTLAGLILDLIGEVGDQ